MHAQVPILRRDQPNHQGPVHNARVHYSLWITPLCCIYLTRIVLVFTVLQSVIVLPECFNPSPSTSLSYCAVFLEYPSASSRLEPMDTIFVKQVKEGGPAQQAGLCTGGWWDERGESDYSLQFIIEVYYSLYSTNMFHSIAHLMHQYISSLASASGFLLP